MFLKIALLLLLPALCHGRNQSYYNGLKVKWDINPANAFDDLPRTKRKAEASNWTRMAPDDACDGNRKFVGFRYWKDEDLSVVLIFGANKFIAGIQAGIPKDYTPNPNRFPKNSAAFVRDGDTYFITAYFINPATVCEGRSRSQFRKQGTGTGLWIQNGTRSVRDSEKMPATQAEVDTTLWTEGACFPTMGVHYWYNQRKDMSCDEWFPVFLLYNDGVLNAFGWAFKMDYRTPSETYEHPPANTYGIFMKVVPDCLYSLGQLSTLHFYLTRNTRANRC